jgi:hypothetical protein
MTVYEIPVCESSIPFCMRCKGRVEEMTRRREDGELWASLLYVHNAWSAAGV